MSGWIKLHRSLKDWEWWDDHNATRLLIYLLVSVNYEQKKWKGITIEPGSLITSYDKLAYACGMTSKQVRGAMQKLENSGETARKRARDGQLVTLVKWEKMQVRDDKEGIYLGTSGAVSGQDEGRTRATTKEIKKEKKERKEEDLKPNGLSVPDAFDSYIKTWTQATGRTIKSKRSEVAKTAIKHFNARIREGYTLEEITTAINNAASDPHHSESGYKWLTLDFILRPQQLERWREDDREQRKEADMISQVAAIAERIEKERQLNTNT